MEKSLYKRGKLGQLPGDLGLNKKIELLEKGVTTIRYTKNNIVVIKGGLGFKKILKAKQRACQKEKDYICIKDFHDGKIEI